MKRIVTLLFSNIGVKFLTIVHGIILARMLGPDQKGVYSLILVLPSLYVAFFDLGIGQSAIRFYRSEKYNIDVIFSNIITISLTLSVFIPIILLAAQNPLSYFFPLIKESMYFYLTFLIYPVLLIQNYLSVFILAVNEVKKFSTFHLIKEALALLLILILYYYKINNLTIIISVYFILNFMFTGALMITISKKSALKWRFVSISVIKDIIKNGFKFNILSIMQWVFYKSNFVLLGFFITDAKSLGIYSVSLALADTLFMISSSASSIIFIDASKGLKDTVFKFDKTILNIKIIIRMMILTGILILIFGYPAIYILYSVEYIGAYLPLFILIPANIIYSIYKLYGSQIAASLYPEKLIMATLFSMIAAVFSNLILIPILGLYGASISTLVSSFASAVSISIYYKRMKNIDYKNMFFITNSEKSYIKARVLNIFKKKVNLF